VGRMGRPIINMSPEELRRARKKAPRTSGAFSFHLHVLEPGPDVEPIGVHLPRP
jgi:hypothetical protein